MSDFLGALGVGMKVRPLSSIDVSDLLSVCDERLAMNLDFRRLCKWLWLCSVLFVCALLMLLLLV